MYYCVNLLIVAVSREMAGKQLKDIQLFNVCEVVSERSLNM